MAMNRGDYFLEAVRALDRATDFLLVIITEVPAEDRTSTEVIWSKGYVVPHCIEVAGETYDTDVLGARRQKMDRDETDDNGDDDA